MEGAQQDTKSVHSVAKSHKSTKSRASKASVAHSLTEEEAKLLQEVREAEEAAYRSEIQKKYIPLVDKTEKKYHPKMVGLNPNMRPTTNQTMGKIFPMQGLWSSKQLMQSTRDAYGVSADEQKEECKQTNKAHFKRMYD